MEFCLVGLFFLVVDENGNNVCFVYAVVIILVLGLTIFYQVAFNQIFALLFRYLPITFEDEAVIYNKAF